MLHRFSAFLLLVLFAAIAEAQRPFEGYFSSDQLDVHSELNLYADSIPVPGLEMDHCYGYLQGRLNGTWVILKVKEIKKDRALVRAVSDRGSDGQDIELRLLPTGNIEARLTGDNNIKGIEGRKYVKFPRPLLLNKMKH